MGITITDVTKAYWLAASNDLPILFRRNISGIEKTEMNMCNKDFAPHCLSVQKVQILLHMVGYECPHDLIIYPITELAFIEVVP